MLSCSTSTRRRSLLLRDCEIFAILRWELCKMTDTEDRIPASRQFHHLAPVSAVSRDEERTGVYLSFFPEVRSRVDTHVIVLVVL